MHVTACLAGQDGVDVEVGEECRSLQALKEAIVVALPKLCVEGFDVCVGGRALDDDEGVVSLQDGLALDVVPNTRGLGVLALREAGREVSEDGLLEAAGQGDVTLVTLYLDAGVPIDCVDSRGNTPLHLSSSRGQLSVSRLLLDRGSAAINEKNHDNCKPLHLACRYAHVEIARLLLDRGGKATGEEDCENSTPLHHACISGHAGLAILLLDRGSAAIDAKNRRGSTPLHLSCCFGHLEIATLLLDRGSTVIDEKDEAGDTPLHLACENGSLELATLLLDRGTTAIDEKNRRGSTPLHHSCTCRHAGVARLLLDRGAAIDEKDCRGWTPLHRSCENRTLELATLFLDRGSTAISEKTNEGYTPEYLAHGHEEISRLLRLKAWRFK